MPLARLAELSSFHPDFFFFFLFGEVDFSASAECTSAVICSPVAHTDTMSSESDESKDVATDVFSSKYLAVQAQKKILGKMASSKYIATSLIDDTSGEVLDELYQVTKEFTQTKKDAEKIIKNLIKTVIKLAVLYRNSQFNQDEIALMEKFKRKVHQLAMTVVSFHQVDYTFDRNVLSKLLNECRDLLHQVIQRHLTAKSHGRINNVFDHFSNCEFLAALYNPFGPYKPHLQRLCDGVNKMLDEDNI
ncbi:PREDICTED: tumor necrosis factor alpha-induced protein 8 [Nanorana parkeri]|uniref:tumor necrosis factor alpha-induced protein 8 n=1 Tax=Nanorana parkeri TaxID=125878 RepID=UPI000854C4DD|nr:PREDICTED: tumor necrosis factor alpha-induced protein 8 [Nanorana parkeri]